MIHTRKPDKVSEFIQTSSSWLLILLFIFTALPLKIANGLFILFALFILISAIYIRPRNVWSNIKENLLIAIPFITYLIDYVLHINNSVVGFELQKKLFFFTFPIALGIYMAMYKLKPLKTYMYFFTASLALLTLYTLSLLSWQGILFCPTSYENGAYLLRTSFENISHLHPTYYSLFATVGILWLIYDYRNQTNTAIKILYIIAGIILLFQELFVAAKMPLAALTVSGLFLFYKITPNRKRLLYIYLVLIPCIIILPLIVPSLNNRIYEVRTFAGPAPGHPNTINDRRIIFDCGKEVFFNNIWFGVGSGNYQAILNECYLGKGLEKAKTVPYNAHNQFFTIGINYGLLPLLLFVITIGIYIKKTISNPFATVLMISTVMVMLTESILERQWGVYFYVLFFVIILNSAGQTKSDPILKQA